MVALGQVLVAVADPTRRAILDRLARGPTRVTDVAAPFAMSLNAVSKHVKVLEGAGLERPRRIEHTWVSEGTRGLESVVTLTFDREGKGMKVTLRHTGVPDDPFGRQHGVGWDYLLGAVAERFANRGG